MSDARQEGVISLYDGITLQYSLREPGLASVEEGATAYGLQIYYCRTGQMVWKMNGGEEGYLNPGDFILCPGEACHSTWTAHSTAQYSGLNIGLDWAKFTAHPPEFLRDTACFKEPLREKFCPQDTVAFLKGNEQTESIFDAFYDQPDEVRLAYQKIKVIELMLYLEKLAFTPSQRFTVFQPGQMDIIREIHDRLTGQMGERVTIEALAKAYLINPTTLKTAFKAVYGTSIAAHIKEHRMEQAAKLLRESDLSIAEIAQAVGYDSQSKFTAAFKTFFGVLPREYRKKY